MASLRASKGSFMLATVNPALSPAPRMLNKVSYFHEGRWQPQVYDSMTNQVNLCVDLKLSPFLVNIDILVVTGVIYMCMVFYLLKLS